VSKEQSLIIGEVLEKSFVCVIMNLPVLIWDTINRRSQMSYHGENDNEKEIGAHTMMCS